MEELILLSSSSFFCVVMAVVALLVFKAYKKAKGTAATKPTASSSTATAASAGTVSLPNGTPIQRKGPFNIIQIDNPENITATADGYRVNYVVGKSGSLSGGMFKAVPAGLPALSATLAYEVFVPDTFEWSKSVIQIPGGKLPGFCIAATEKGCATGGNWQEFAGSFRPMWREDGKVIGYWYAAVKGATQSGDFLKDQGTGVQAVAEPSGTAGVNLWYRKDPGLTLKRGAWNSISMSLNLGTAGKTNGSISLTVNGVTKKVNDVKWRDSETVKITSFEVVSFAGGGDEKWAFKKPTYTLFRNIKLTT